jgi:flavin reductase (DIM6/NTAB) family NADH-FMN oxidoreductase RutF
LLEPATQALIGGIFREAVREIWIITSADGARRGGLTATWVSAASMDPATPLALIALAPNHYTCDLVDWSGAFTAHLLREDQTELAWRFASTSGRDGDKFAGLEVTQGELGTPRLDDCLARLECQVIHRVTTGDRVFFWGSVVRADRFSTADPLTDRRWFASLSDDRRRLLGEQLGADLDIQRPLFAAWSAKKPTR